MHYYIYKSITNLGSNSDALGGSPAPSTIQENSADPLLGIVFELEVMISFSRACRIFNHAYNKLKSTAVFLYYFLNLTWDSPHKIEVMHEIKMWVYVLPML